MAYISEQYIQLLNVILTQAICRNVTRNRVCLQIYHYISGTYVPENLLEQPKRVNRRFVLQRLWYRKI